MGILLGEDKLNELYDEFAEQSEQPNWEMFLLKKQLKRVYAESLKVTDYENMDEMDMLTAMFDFMEALKEEAGL